MKNNFEEGGIARTQEPGGGAGGGGFDDPSYGVIGQMLGGQCLEIRKI